MALSPTSSRGGGTSTSAVLASTPVVLTNAQIKALPGTDIQLVAAPGASKTILPLYAFLTADFAVAYSGIDANTEYPAVWLAQSNSPIYLNEFIDQPSAEGGSSLTSFLTTTNESGRVGYTLELVQSWAVRGSVSGGTTVTGIAQSGLSAPFSPDALGNVSLKIGADNSVNFGGGNAANTLTVSVLYTVLDV